MQLKTTDLREGVLVRWDDEKGFGFIRPNDGGKDTFIHISAFSPGMTPRPGVLLVFSVIDDPRGRGQRALKAVPANGATIEGDARDPALEAVKRSTYRAATPARSRNAQRFDAGAARPGRRSRQRDTTLKPLPLNALTILVGSLTLVCLVGAVSFFPVTPVALFAYPIASLAVFFAYARDKLKAIEGAWRIPESSLHLLEFLGGWPGAYIAQQTMRHKTIKFSYQVTYWAIVCIHVAFWVAWFLSPELVMQQLQPFISSIWRY